MQTELEKLFESNPAVFAQTPSPRVSAKYTFIPTNEIINSLLEEGWGVESIKQRRSPRSREFGKHMIRFRHKDMLTPMKGDSIPEIVVINSHDGTSSYQLRAGIFRLICANGAVVAEKDFGTIRIQHRNLTTTQVKEASQRILDNVDRIMSKIEDWENIELSQEQQFNFASEAAKLRFPSVDFTTDNLSCILQINRPQDQGFSLWKVYNRIQENIMRGGYKSPTSNRIVRGITGIEKDIELNTKLWELANKYSEASRY